MKRVKVTLDEEELGLLCHALSSSMPYADVEDPGSMRRRMFRLRTKLASKQMFLREFNAPESGPLGTPL